MLQHRMNGKAQPQPRKSLLCLAVSVIFVMRNATEAYPSGQHTFLAPTPKAMVST